MCKVLSRQPFWEHGRKSWPCFPSLAGPAKDCQITWVRSARNTSERGDWAVVVRLRGGGHGSDDAPQGTLLAASSPPPPPRTRARSRGDPLQSVRLTEGIETPLPSLQPLDLPPFQHYCPRGQGRMGWALMPSTRPSMAKDCHLLWQDSWHSAAPASPCQ